MRRFKEPVVLLNTDVLPEFEGLKSDSEYAGLTDDEIWSLAYENIDMEVVEFKNAASKVDLPGNIVCIGDCGYWRGRREGVRLLGDTLDTILFSSRDIDERKIEFDGVDVTGYGIHHDGTDHYIFRVLNQTPKGDEIRERLDCGDFVDRKTIMQNSKSLRPYAKKAFDWL